ncbi:pirin family protein [Streptomyces sp. NPDC046203]|uniref:pirin family protein n=1 Tax=Streptomyces sp. NPDC046203 TaxID=3154602 RepID=UPI0033CCF775
MILIQRADERYPGGDPGAGIDTRHAFSFGRFYDPANLRFGALLACNEERLAPGAGFDEHPHSHTEIVTWVVEGELTHRDSTGHATVLRPGDLQYLSAASGVRHTERNDGAAPLAFVQMWLAPAEAGGEPSYEVVRGAAGGGARGSGPADGGSAGVLPAEGVPAGAGGGPAVPGEGGAAFSYAVPAAAATLHVHRPAAGDRVALPDADTLYVHVVRGAVRLADHDLAPGDAVRATAEKGLTLLATADAETLVWAMRDTVAQW